MTHRSTILVLAVLFVIAAYSQSPPSPHPPTGAPTTDAKPAPQPPSVPPAGAPSDLGSIPEHPNKPQSAVKKHLKRLEPHCMDAALHTCWSSPSAEDSASDNSGFWKNLDVAKLYLSQKNYRGAESRLEDALAAKPHDPEATFLWAESLERLHRSSEAVGAYRSYLTLQPQGKFAAQARRALKRLEATRASTP
ncbi:MAG TPA: tetratricopeptide repeat protein [Terriglobales bacterium]|nr:tetratricopeptide repeat protein [Terriglobales bacterium]